MAEAEAFNGRSVEECAINMLLAVQDDLCPPNLGLRVATDEVTRDECWNAMPQEGASKHMGFHFYPKDASAHLIRDWANKEGWFLIDVPAGFPNHLTARLWARHLLYGLQHLAKLFVHPQNDALPAREWLDALVCAHNTHNNPEDEEPFSTFFDDVSILVVPIDPDVCVGNFEDAVMRFTTAVNLPVEVDYS